MDVTVTEPMLRAAAQKADGVSGEISAELDKLVGMIQSEGQASLQGTAGTALQSVTVELHQELRKLTGALTTMAGAVRQSSAVLGSSDVDAGQDITRAGGAHGYGGGDVARALGG
jgi:WXG100 family type VII secretion target